MREMSLVAIGSLFFLGTAAASLPDEPAVQKSAAETAQKVVIPFDLESKFDNGEYGQIIGDMVWKKLRRDGGFVIPESMQDVRDLCQRVKLAPSPQTPLSRMKEIVVKEQAGDIGIWGKVERVRGFDSDVYDLWINVADFSVDPPIMIYQKKARTQTASEIPHVYVKAALDRLYGRSELLAAAPETQREKHWENASNLFKGDFEAGRGAPAGWDPLPHDVSWVAETGKPATPKNKIIRFSLNEDVAGTTGVLYYSVFFPVEEGATYRFQCRWRTTGSAAKVLVKCYDELPTSFRTDSDAEPLKTEKREVYRNQQNLQGSLGGSNLQTEDLTPQHTHQYTPRWGRVMLYAYSPVCTVERDDVVVKLIPLRRHARARRTADRQPRPRCEPRKSRTILRQRQIPPRQGRNRPRAGRARAAELRSGPHC